MSRLHTLRMLTADAVRDGLRSRVGLFALVFALLVGLFAHRCTGLDAGSLVLNGHEFSPRSGAEIVGSLVYAVCALLLVLVAGFVACDALERPLSEGAATLALARPVGRASYALSRLAGSLLLALAAGVVVLAMVTGMLHLRLGLSPAPALVGIAVFATDAWVVAAVAMPLGLLLPRVVALGSVVIGMQLVVFSNAIHAVGTTTGSLLNAIERWGPPLGTALLYALAPWFSGSASPADWLDVGVRLLVWGAGASALLVFLFRRIDLPS
jgi:hypothetical protein